MNSQSPGTLSFTGPIPVHYDRYLGPMFFEAYALDICSRINSPSVKSALELCCGTGRVTRHLRNILMPDARLIASDISPDMMEVAKDKLHTATIDWQIIDAQQIPYAENAFDLVVCSFGFMLIPDRKTAFEEAFRVLKPGGTLLMSTWDKLERNEASFVFRTIIKKYFGDSLPETYKLPFSMHQPELIREELMAAGFSNVDVEVVEKKSVCVSAKEAAYGLLHGGSLYNEIIKRDATWLTEISETVESELASRYGDSPMIAPMRALISQATK